MPWANLWLPALGHLRGATSSNNQGGQIWRRKLASDDLAKY